MFPMREVEIIKNICLLIFFLIYSVQDIKKKEISIRYLWAFALVGVLLYLFPGRGFSLGSLVGGLLIGGGILLLSLVTKGSIGMGDGLMLAISGIYLGFSQNGLLLMLALFYSAIWSLVLIFRKKAKRKQEIPFIPFLFAGYVTLWIGGI